MKASELKTGDWFEYEGKRYLCVDPRCEEWLDVACWSPEPETGTRFVHPQWNVTPLPDCTGWDWQPEPKVQYRNEHRLGVGRWHDNKSECDAAADAAWENGDNKRIGYTIRRVWPDGRVEQEFVQESSYEV